MNISIKLSCSWLYSTTNKPILVLRRHCCKQFQCPKHKPSRPNLIRNTSFNIYSSTSSLLSNCVFSRATSTVVGRTTPKNPVGPQGDRGQLRFPFLGLGLRSSKIPSNTNRYSAQGIHENIATLQVKKRPLRRKVKADEDTTKPGFWNVVAYATSEEYDLEKLAVGLREQDLYEVFPLECDSKSTQTGLTDVVHAMARYQVGSEPREIFFFREGSLVLWNFTELEVDTVLQFVRQYEHNSYDARLMLEESESMKYTYSQPGKKSHLESGHGTMVLASETEVDFDKYTFSNAMALSVKLGVWEASLDRYVDSIEFVTEDLKQGTRISMSRDEVLRKTGQLFALRHLINLSSDLLDTPDFYWDRDQLEALYLQTCGYFSIARRTKVMNEKLNHCVELVELLSDHLSDRHHVRLEWMIIILIMVEVGFEVLHYAHQ